VTGRVVSELTTRAKDAESYTGFWENFGPVLKEGIYEDFERRAEIAPLLRFRSSAVEGWTSLPDYVARMKDGQEAIYYLVADDAEALKSSPQLEGFKARGLEVLLLSDHVDAFWPDQLGTFAEKPLRSITKGGLDLSKFAPEGEPQSEAPEGIDAFVAAVKAALGGEVSDVRTTDRLVDSAVVLSAGGSGPDLQMQRLMRRAGRAGAGQPVLEINPRHPLIRSLAAAPESEVPQAAGTLLDLARIQDGDSPRDPAAFARTVAAALAAARSA
jgi:molecular chaperone HtpG